MNNQWLMFNSESVTIRAISDNRIWFSNIKKKDILQLQNKLLMYNEKKTKKGWSSWRHFDI